MGSYEVYVLLNKTLHKRSWNLICQLDVKNSATCEYCRSKNEKESCVRDDFMYLSLQLSKRRDTVINLQLFLGIQKFCFPLNYDKHSSYIRSYLTLSFTLALSHTCMNGMDVKQLTTVFDMSRFKNIKM